MSKLLILSLVSACATTSPSSPAAPTTPIQDESKACEPSAEVIFTIARNSDTPNEHATSTFRIYSSGLWRFHETEAGGKPGRKLEGCVKDDRLGKIVTTLDAAPWTMTRADMTCMAYSAQFVDYEVAGRHVWSERMCGPEQLDATSKQALGEASALVSELVPAKS
jgi:hypothetical protein